SASSVSHASIFRLAMFRVSSRSPLCPCNEPQQFCAWRMTISHHAYCDNCDVALFVDLCIVFMRQPEEKATFILCFIVGNKCRGLRFISVRFGAMGRTFSIARTCSGKIFIMPIFQAIC